MKAISIACLIIICIANASGAQAKQRPVKNYGNATIAKIIAVENAYTFRCDIEGWPAIIGKDIPVRINGITEPKIVSENGKPNRFFQMQAKKFLADCLENSKKIEIRNIKRGRDFSLIADVVTDSNSLSATLVKNEFARKLTREEIKDIRNPTETSRFRTTKPRPEAHLSRRSEVKTEVPGQVASAPHYVASKTSKVFHEPTCRFARSMDEKKTLKFSSKQQAINSGRRACKICGK